MGHTASQFYEILNNRAKLATLDKLHAYTLTIQSDWMEKEGKRISTLLKWEQEDPEALRELHSNLLVFRREWPTHKKDIQEKEDVAGLSQWFGEWEDIAVFLTDVSEEAEPQKMAIGEQEEDKEENKEKEEKEITTSDKEEQDDLSGFEEKQSQIQQQYEQEQKRKNEELALNERFEQLLRTLRKQRDLLERLLHGADVVSLSEEDRNTLGGMQHQLPAGSWTTEWLERLETRAKIKKMLRLRSNLEREMEEQQYRRCTEEQIADYAARILGKSKKQ